MAKLVAVAGRTLTQSNPTPATVNFTIVETDLPATRTKGSGQPVLIDRIALACTCGGNFSPTQKYVGTGNAEIVSGRQRLRCEGKPLLLIGDQVTIACSGTATDTTSGTTMPANASVTVTITDAKQTTVRANEA
jgi:uncharacterized Zn-binding protein involved in type VI secretion